MQRPINNHDSDKENENIIQSPLKHTYARTHERTSNQEIVDCGYDVHKHQPSIVRARALRQHIRIRALCAVQSEIKERKLSNLFCFVCFVCIIRVFTCTNSGISDMSFPSHRV